MHNFKRGFSFIELGLVLTIIGIVSAIAVPSYTSHVEKTRATQAIADIQAMGLLLEKFHSENGRYPNSLADIGKGGLKDPWDRAYKYLNMENDPHNTLCRKIGPVHPLNTDYDLYSVGKDGRTSTPINAGPSQDDVIRAYDGSYIGLARNII